MSKNEIIDGRHYEYQSNMGTLILLICLQRKVEWYWRRRKKKVRARQIIQRR